MGLFAQLAHTFVIGPLAVLRMRGRTLGFLLLYLVLGGGLLGGVAWAVLAHRSDLTDALSAYLLPEDWRFAARHLVDRLFASQLRGVLVNASVGGSLVLLSALLFPLKERVSATFEEEARLQPGERRLQPRWLRAMEELSLFVAYGTAQMTIFGLGFWLGYPPDPVRKEWAVGLSYLVLFTYFSMNFVSPLLQRRGLRYSTILKVLVLHPIVLVGFGALFTLPSVAVARVTHTHTEWSLARSVGLLFATNVACIAVGTIAGTSLAARLWPVAARTRPPSLPLRAAVWLAVLGLFALNGYRFGAVGRSLHRKSQILKCHYRIDPSKIALDLPSLDGILHSSSVTLALRFDVTIENPTAYAVELEKNRLEVTHAGARLALASLSPLAVPAGQSRTQHVELPVVVNPQLVMQKGRTLFDWQRWSMTLYLEVAPGFEWPIHLLSE